MITIQGWAWLTGISFAAGLNVYATVVLVGLMGRLGWIQLPPDLVMMTHPLVLGIAGFLYAIEFVADKVPYVDNVWDAIHTFVRPPAAALLAFGAVAGVPEQWRWTAALIAGGIALASHGAKASTRAAINVSPEPFSNVAVSLAEDAVVVALVWMATKHPVLTTVVVTSLILLALFLIARFVRMVFRLFRRMFAGAARGH